MKSGTSIWVAQFWDYKFLFFAWLLFAIWIKTFGTHASSEHPQAAVHSRHGEPPISPCPAQLSEGGSGGSGGTKKGVADALPKLVNKSFSAATAFTLSLNPTAAPSVPVPPAQNSRAALMNMLLFITSYYLKIFSSNSLCALFYERIAEEWAAALKQTWKLKKSQVGLVVSTISCISDVNCTLLKQTLSWCHMPLWCD